ncbi:MAG: hypothetical protein OXQ94_16735 [Gemmatimonadota bacterium]|nr:hypothetical protein [Gemmatimonadota bacterium]MDE2873326.1 hypothetical protein [Gemmatimonadota bacterium]
MKTPIPLRTLLLPALVAAALSAPRPASAQPTRADSVAVLLATAEHFANRGAHDIAKALYRHVVEHFPGSAVAETALSLLEGVTTRHSQAGGEVELKVWSALYGIWQGIAIPLAASAEEAETYGFGLLVGGSAGFLAGRELARSRPRSLGQARAITWGGTWGAIQGWGWARVLNLGSSNYGHPYRDEDDEYLYHFEDDESLEATILSMIVGGAAGIAGGTALARKEITPGTATSAMLGSLWGLWFGISTGILLDAEGDDLTAAAMVAGNAGLVAGALAGSRVPISRPRARLISVGGVVGAFAGLGMSLIAQPDSHKEVIGLILASSIGGLAVGAAGTRGDRGEPVDVGDAEEAASLPAPGALLNWSDGDWALSAPLPSAVRQPTSRSGGRDALAWKIPLLNVRF